MAKKVVGTREFFEMLETKPHNASAGVERTPRWGHGFQKTSRTVTFETCGRDAPYFFASLTTELGKAQIRSDNNVLYVAHTYANPLIKLKFDDHGPGMPVFVRFEVALANMNWVGDELTAVHGRYRAKVGLKLEGTTLNCSLWADDGRAYLHLRCTKFDIQTPSHCVDAP